MGIATLAMKVHIAGILILMHRQVARRGIAHKMIVAARQAGMVTRGARVVAAREQGMYAHLAFKMPRYFAACELM